MRRIVVVALLGIWLMGCGGGDSNEPRATPGAAGSHPIAEVGDLGQLAAEASSATASVGQSGAALQLGDGSSLQVPAGALAAGTRITLTRTTLALSSISIASDDPVVYAVEADVPGGAL